jgi:transcriptional regulator with XRE-family HTH domain
MLNGLRLERVAKGLTQEELAENSGVGRDTIQKLETGKRPARLATVKKLADALGVEIEELIKGRKEESVEEIRTAEKVEVEVRWETDYGTSGEILRFRGEEIDRYEEKDVYFTLYECPGGYRVHVDYADGEQPAFLNPFRPDRNTGEIVYSTYTAEELVEEFPAFGATVGVMRVRDID